MLAEVPHPAAEARRDAQGLGGGSAVRHAGDVHAGVCVRFCRGRGGGCDAAGDVIVVARVCLVIVVFIVVFGIGIGIGVRVILQLGRAGRRHVACVVIIIIVVVVVIIIELCLSGPAGPAAARRTWGSTI